MSKAPDYVLKTRRITRQRQWRVIKRRELNAVIEAFKKFRTGCAFCPGYADGTVDKAGDTLNQLKSALSPRQWK